MILTLRHEHSHSISPASLEALRGILQPFALKLDAIETAVNQLTKQGAQQAMDLTRLTASVKKNTDGIASAKEALAGVAQQIRDNVTNQAALNTLADTLDADDAGLAAAIVANTPAAGPLQPAA